jgi:hypothetical protein
VGTGYGNELSFSTTADTILQVGCYYRGGIIAYILQDGDPGYDPNVQHGLIAAPFDQTSHDGLGVPWGCWGLEIGSSSYDVGAGQNNTDLVLSKCNEPSIAAKLCSNLVIDGYSDWVLPSRYELALLIQNQFLIGGFFQGQSYWSSSEASNESAHAQQSFFGSNGVGNKGALFHVRAIRYF